MTLERFHFEIDGTDYSVPRSIPFGLFRKVREMDPLAQIATILEALAEPDTLAALDTLEPIDVAKKLKGWLGGGPGESSSSST